MEDSLSEATPHFLNIGAQLRRNPLSPMRYPGGKGILGDYFVNLLNQLPHIDTYIEPFAGGAGTACAVLLNTQVQKVVINDLDIAVFSFWEAVKSEPDRLCHEIRDAELSISKWREHQRRYKTLYASGVPSFELGFSFFYLNRTSRSGLVSGGVIGGLEQSGKYKIDARFNRKTLVSRIERLSRESARLCISNQDAIDLLKQSSGQDNSLFYLDPPYVVQGPKLYLSRYDTTKHRSLSDTLIDLRHLHWALSYDNEPEIIALYSAFKRTSFTLGYSANRRYQGSEVMFFSTGLEMELLDKGFQR